MRAKFLFFLLLSIHISFSQEKKENDKFLCIKAAPLSLLDIYSGMSPRLGVEYKLEKKFTTYNEIGTYIPNVNAMSNNKGYLTKWEIKRYFDEDISQSAYTSIELFYKHQSYGTQDSIFINGMKYLKDYTVKKDVVCATAKLGVLNCFESGFLVDFFIGFGVRHRIINSTLTNEENQNIQQDGSSNINIWKNKSGVFNALNFDAGLKIGYRIK